MPARSARFRSRWLAFVAAASARAEGGPLANAEGGPLANAEGGPTAAGGGVGERAPGLDADLVLWSGDPLNLGSRVEAVYVQGKRVHQ